MLYNNMHQFDLLTKCLKKQKFKDFELVLVDAFYEGRKNYFVDNPQPYHVKHIPYHVNHRFWFDRRYWSICAALNSGLIVSEGESIQFLTDCLEFDEDFLQKHFEWLEKGYSVLTTFKGFYEGKWDFDDRYRYSEKIGSDLIQPLDGNWFYGSSSAKLSALLKVNGFDELFDGCKSLEDCDMGHRLFMIGYNKFIWDKSMMLTNHHTRGDSLFCVFPKQAFKSNYYLLMLNKRKRRWRVNDNQLSDKDIEWVKNMSRKETWANINVDSPEFELWRNNQPNFNLMKERIDAGY